MNEREKAAIGEVVVDKKAFLLGLEISSEGYEVGVGEAAKHVHVSSELLQTRVCRVL